MPSVEQLRTRLVKKLSELFQLDQPDLDFGFYRIMHAKAREVHDFISNDLLKIVADAFSGVDAVRKAELQEAYEKAIQSAKEFGSPNPEETAPVKRAKAALDALKETANSEAEVYDHLYRFFERYYDDGDFISRRYYTRETADKAAPFAIPYNGEEVKLHWANADQYYIKTAEYFSNYSFDLMKAKEIQRLDSDMFSAPDKKSTMKVHFKVVDATEGEHGNVKASEQTKRFFIIHEDKPVEFNESGELVCNFQYRPDSEKTGQDGKWREHRNSEAIKAILNALENHRWTQTDTDEGQEKKSHAQPPESVIQEYLRLLKVPTENDKTRPVLAKYINQYTARNTMDYFIHKDLGSFLRRELDFYIKNEVMRLDDIENADAPSVESYLSKIRVMRKIAGKLIDFLAQLEDFQKKLWLKKKFIVETNYCITLDRIPEDMYPEIAANDAQIDEWIKLFAIDEIQKDLHCPAFSRPLTPEFLKANDKLVLDTRFFDEDFKARVVASMDDFDEKCDGLLIHSENFQALNVLKNRFAREVRCIAIDPPYNTGNGDFNYKDSYKHSCWLTMMYDRLELSKILLSEDYNYFCCSGEDEQANLKNLYNLVFGEKNVLPTAYWEKVYSPRMDALALSEDHDQISISGTGVCRIPFEQNDKQFSEIDHTNGKRYRRRSARKEGSNSRRQDRPNLYYPITTPDGTLVYPIRSDGSEGCWRWSQEKYQIKSEAGELEWVETETGWQLYAKQYYDENSTMPPSSLWNYKLAGHNHEATQQIKDFFSIKAFSTPKPVKLFELMFRISARNGALWILDYFAGSGTAGNALINLFRKDTQKGKYILVEMGDYFDSVLKPRIAKVAYSETWKDGKPTSRQTGISHCFKYIRLESYEDTLNNLQFDENPSRKKVLQSNQELMEDYMLRYMLDVETRGSKSLLNIEAFADPTAYTLEVKKPGTDEYSIRPVDLIETFNYLIGLRVVHYAAPQEFTASFMRLEDPEVPQGQKTKLVLEGKLQQIRQNHELTRTDTNKKNKENDSCSLVSISGSNSWWFRKVEGWVPKDSSNPNNGQKEKVLIVWRRLTGDLEKDNLMLDEWFQKNRIRTRDFEFDTIYVNGSNNLPNLKLDEDNWKVRLIEEEFMKRMWDVEGI